MRTDRSRQDRGFTLVELLICVALTGILASVTASVIIVALKTSPAAEDRADAAVNVQGLVTWLPQDVDSTAPGSFDTSLVPSGCAGTDPGFNLMKMSWHEKVGTTTNFTVSYRYVPLPVPTDGGRIVRVYCIVGGAPQVLNVSGIIPEWLAGAEPVRITLSDAPDSDGLTLYDTARFEVEPIAGKTIVIVGTTKNPAETLSGPSTTSPPTTTIPPVNQPPVADNLAYTIASGVPVSFSVSGTDPEGGALTAAFPAIPVDWTVTSTGALTFTVTAPATAAGTAVPIGYVVTDPLGLSGSATVTFTVQPIAAANEAPSANPSSGSTTAGAAVVVTLLASDPEGGLLTASVTGVPSGWTTSVAGLTVTVTPSSDAAAGNFVMDYTVTDPLGLANSSTLTVTITAPPPCVITGPSLDRTTVTLKKNDPDALFDTVTATITIVSGYCVGLALHYDTGAPNGQYVRNFATSGTSRSVTLPKHPSAELWSVGTKVLQVKDSSNLVIGSVNLGVTL